MPDMSAPSRRDHTTAAPSISEQFANLANIIVDGLTTFTGILENIRARLGENDLTADEAQDLRHQEAQVTATLEHMDRARQLCAAAEERFEAQNANMN